MLVVEIPDLRRSLCAKRKASEKCWHLADGAIASEPAAAIGLAVTCDALRSVDSFNFKFTRRWELKPSGPCSCSGLYRAQSCFLVASGHHAPPHMAQGKLLSFCAVHR